MAIQMTNRSRKLVVTYKDGKRDAGAVPMFYQKMAEIAQTNLSAETNFESITIGLQLAPSARAVNKPQSHQRSMRSDFKLFIDWEGHNHKVSVYLFHNTADEVIVAIAHAFGTLREFYSNSGDPYYERHHWRDWAAKTAYNYGYEYANKMQDKFWDWTWNTPNMNMQWSQFQKEISDGVRAEKPKEQVQNSKLTIKMKKGRKNIAAADLKFSEYYQKMIWLCEDYLRTRLGDTSDYIVTLQRGPSPMSGYSQRNNSSLYGQYREQTSKGLPHKLVIYVKDNLWPDLHTIAHEFGHAHHYAAGENWGYEVSETHADYMARLFIGHFESDEMMTADWPLIESHCSNLWNEDYALAGFRTMGEWEQSDTATRYKKAVPFWQDTAVSRNLPSYQDIFLRNGRCHRRGIYIQKCTADKLSELSWAYKRRQDNKWR